MARSLLAVLVGALFGTLLVFGTETLGHLVYPTPEGLDPIDIDALAAYVQTAPLGALLFVHLAWALGSFGGGWVAARMAAEDRTRQGLVVGALLMALGLVTMFSFPHPSWFWLGALVFLPSAYGGARLAQRGA